MLVFSMAIMFLLPTMITVFIPSQEAEMRDDLFDTYYEMTGQEAQTKTAIWILTGLYTPVEEGAPYLVTSDGWMARSELKSWTPSQYLDTPEQYTVTKGSDGYFRYIATSDPNDDPQAATPDYDATTGTGHYDGELYTAFNFDPQYMSDIFFTESSRTNMGENFYYEYTGVRAAFQPISTYTIVNENGDRVPVIATETSLSCVWYSWYTQTGIASQLTLSGNNGGVAYLNGASIVSAFNSVNNTATFSLVFNGGINIDVIIRLDPYYLATMTVQECYNRGYWSMLITSESVDQSAYSGTDSALNPMRIFETMVDLLTFNYEAYGIGGLTGVVCSIVFVMPLFATLIAVAVDKPWMWLIVGILGLIEVIQSINLFSVFG